jgi:hypothetical protein
VRKRKGFKPKKTKVVGQRRGGWGMMTGTMMLRRTGVMIHRENQIQPKQLDDREGPVEWMESGGQELAWADLSWELQVNLPECAKASPRKTRGDMRFLM